MIQDYIRGAMRRAAYKILPDDGSYFGEIPGFQGVWANNATLEECRTELEEVLEDWILLKVSTHDPLPEVDGINLVIRQAV